MGGKAGSARAPVRAHQRAGRKADAGLSPRGDGGRLALLVVDMINTFEFEGGRALAREAQALVPRLLRLRAAFASADLPVVHCNDNFGHWRSDFRAVVERCSAPRARGARIARRLHPDPHEYFVLKPRHSAFLATPLDLLLRSLGVRTLAITGIASDDCVLATALDARMRDYEVTIVTDACAAQSAARHRRAMALLAATRSARMLATRALLAGMDGQASR
jgi:nicotinamidase-related amidase